MKLVKIIVFLYAFVITTSCKKEKKEVLKQEDIIELIRAAAEEKIEKEKKTLSVNLTPKNDRNITGSITFIESEGMVNMIAEINGLSQGKHAIHIHEKAEAKQGYYKEDTIHFKANANSICHITYATNEWCIGCDNKKKNIIGKAITVHEKINDSISQSSDTYRSIISSEAIIQ